MNKHFEKPKMIIGLAGKKRCGKDSVAAYLCAYYGFHQDSFAAPIRTFVASLCGYTLNELEAMKEEIHPLFGISPREMMQTLGTEWGRDRISKTVWLDSLIHRLKNRRTVISDIRFDNEAEAIRKLGGTIIHLCRKGNEDTDDHASEAGIKVLEEDIYLPNNGTLVELYRNTADIIIELEKNYG